jgi:uncharacterized membrane protein YdcZ (DUF606 family)
VREVLVVRWVVVGLLVRRQGRFNSRIGNTTAAINTFLVLPSWEGTTSLAFMSLTFPPGSPGLHLHWNFYCD